MPEPSPLPGGIDPAATRQLVGRMVAAGLVHRGPVIIKQKRAKETKPRPPASPSPGGEGRGEGGPSSPSPGGEGRGEGGPLISNPE